MLPYVDVCVRIQSYVSIHTQILVTQVPGYYTDASRDKWGHLQVRRLLARGGAVFPPRKVSSSCKDVIVAQFTSFASLNEKYRTNSNPVSHLDCDQTTIPWLTEFEIVADVKKSRTIYGLSSGESCPVVKNAQAVLKDGALRTGAQIVVMYVNRVWYLSEDVASYLHALEPLLMEKFWIGRS